MRRIMRVGSGAFAGAAALVMSLAAVAPAQQAQPDPAPLTEAQAAGVRRVEEMIEVLNTGDYATIRAYFEANSVGAPNPSAGAKTFSGHVPTLSHVLDRYSTSRGLDLVRVTTERHLSKHHAAADILADMEDRVDAVRTEGPRREGP